MKSGCRECPACEAMTGHKARYKVAGFGEYVHLKLATDHTQ